MAARKDTGNGVALARAAVDELLDGKPPNGTTPDELGIFGECYAELLRAYSGGGHAAVRQAYAVLASHNPAIAALRAADPEPPRQSWSVTDLLTTSFPEPKWGVSDLLPVGLSVLAGRPKMGKSWLALSIAAAVGIGGQVLGRRVDKGRVLYLALEDYPRRIQDRLRKQKVPTDTAIDFRFSWKDLSEGGIADLSQAITEQGFSLVITDTISRALTRADQLDQADMNVAFGALQRLALEKEICILLVDHHRKSAGSAGDVIDDVMGATSKVGVADAALGLYRERGQSTATLKVSGRDIDDQELALQWDTPNFCWQPAETIAGVKTESVQANVVTVMNEMGGQATTTQIANRLNKDKGNISRELQELITKGIVRRGESKQGREVLYILVPNDD